MGRINITQLEYSESYKEPMTICLGFFDSLHVGHIQLIERSKLLAHKYNCKNAVFTFENNPFSILGKDSLQVLTYDERCYRLDNLGVDIVVHAFFDNVFMQYEPIEFLDKLITNKNIKAIVVGTDYTYGKYAKGTTETLQQYCNSHNIELVIEQMKLLDDGSKISSRYLRKLIRQGNLSQIAYQLNTPYFIMGKVIHGRKDGAKIGFKTANITYNTMKEKLPEGVYNTNVLLNNIKLKAVTNVGIHPTFNDNSFNIESHIIGLNQDIYDQDIIIEFIEKIRDIKKFSSIKELSDQIQKDVNYVLR